MALSQSQKERVLSLIYDDYTVWKNEDDENPDVDEEATRTAYEALLAQVESPEELHAYASEFNWDCGCEEMRDVIRHPLCDLGTALLIYWHAAPSWFLQYADRSEVGEHEIDTLTLIEEIEQRVRDQQYKTASQPFDPRNDRGTDWTTLYDDEAKGLVIRKKTPFHAIPSFMDQAVGKE
jgi:hypothetical protein